MYICVHFPIYVMSSIYEYFCTCVHSQCRVTGFVNSVEVQSNTVFRHQPEALHPSPIAVGGGDHAAESREAGRLPFAGQPETQSHAINVCTLNEYFSLHHQTPLPIQHTPAAAFLCYGCSQHSAVFSGSSNVIIFFYLNFKIRSPTIKTIASLLFHTKPYIHHHENDFHRPYTW